METFDPPRHPTYEADKITRIRLLRALRGDAPSKQAETEAREPSGEFSLSWPVLSVAQADTIHEFFEAHDGFEAFEYNLPFEPKARKFICRDWIRRGTKPGYALVRAKFEEDIDP